jgi:hypothetical protein
LLLVVVTLGLYVAWWHWKVHDEVCDFMGRRNTEQRLWGAYLGIHLLINVGYMLLVLSFVPAASSVVGGVLAVLLMPGLLILVGILLLAVVGLVLFVVYVRQQILMVAEAKRSLGLTVRTTPSRFFGIYFGGLVLQVLTPMVGPIGLVVLPIAYLALQEEYNDIHAHMQGQEGTSVSVAPAVPFEAGRSGQRPVD